MGAPPVDPGGAIRESAHGRGRANAGHGVDALQNGAAKSGHLAAVFVFAPGDRQPQGEDGLGLECAAPV